MIDLILESYHKAYGLDYVSFRYFNACGADPQGRHGQEPGATHLIARFLEATRDEGTFKIYGVDYDTLDGTCVRDYVHVDDIAQAHVLSLYMRVPPGVYNLGSNQGTTVKQVVERAMAITGKRPEIMFGAARPGDPPVLVALANKYAAIGWRKNYTLDDMIQHSWNWYTK
jgi:UDP-glucose 4-epimerase